MKEILAQIPLAPEGGFRGKGPLGLEGKSAAQGPLIFNKFISSAIGLMTLIAFIWFIFQFFIGAIGILSSGGDKAKLTEARSKITTGLIGMVVVVAGIFIIDLFGKLMGLEILRGALLVPSLLVK